MAGTSTLRDSNENNKFVDDSNGHVAVNTVTEVTNDASNPVPVEIVDGTIGTDFDLYNEVLAVAGASTAKIITYVVPVATTLKLKTVQVSGSNIAEYTVKIDGVVKAKKRSYFTDYDRKFELTGINVEAGETITVEVDNYRSSSADFNATLIGTV